MFLFKNRRALLLLIVDRVELLPFFLKEREELFLVFIVEGVSCFNQEIGEVEAF